MIEPNTAVLVLALFGTVFGAFLLQFTGNAIDGASVTTFSPPNQDASEVLMQWNGNYAITQSLDCVVNSYSIKISG